MASAQGADAVTLPVSNVKRCSDVQQVRIFAESSKDKVLAAVQELSQTGLLSHFCDVQWLQQAIFTLTTG